ncbi:MAG: hypothetical protein IJH82_08000, partial [Lachnospiraceae bacterium]|nr:hypothetical protein [Lachnospiraceae bacterium]
KVFFLYPFIHKTWHDLKNIRGNPALAGFHPCLDSILRTPTGVSQLPSLSFKRLRNALFIFKIIAAVY